LIPYSEERWTLLYVILGISSIAYAFDEMGILRLPRPQRLKQVPASWRALFHPHITAILYGFGLGTGIATRIVSNLLYIVILGLFLHAHPAYAAVTFSLFGLGRGGSIIVAGWFIRNLHSGEELDLVLRRLAEGQNRVHAIAGVILATLGGYWGVEFYLTL